MAFDYSYRFTEKAVQDLDEILHYISVELDNPIAAKNLGKKIFDQIDNVRCFPESGALVSNDYLADKTIRKMIVDHYVVYYKAHHEEKMISIVRVVYGKRNLDEILRQI